MIPSSLSNIADGPLSHRGHFYYLSDLHLDKPLGIESQLGSTCFTSTLL